MAPQLLSLLRRSARRAFAAAPRAGPGSRCREAARRTQDRVCRATTGPGARRARWRGRRCERSSRWSSSRRTEAACAEPRWRPFRVLRRLSRSRLTPRSGKLSSGGGGSSPAPPRSSRRLRLDERLGMHEGRRTGLVGPVAPEVALVGRPRTAPLVAIGLDGLGLGLRRIGGRAGLRVGWGDLGEGRLGRGARGASRPDRCGCRRSRRGRCPRRPGPRAPRRPGPPGRPACRFRSCASVQSSGSRIPAGRNQQEPYRTYWRAGRGASGCRMGAREPTGSHASS